MNFYKSTSPGVKTDPAVTVLSDVFKTINTHKLDYQFHVGYKQFVLQINEFQRNVSGWVVDHLQHLHLGISNTIGLRHCIANVLHFH